MTNSDFKLTSEQVKQDGKTPVTIFYLRGWLDAQCEEKLFTATQEAHSQGALKIVFHLEDVQILTSAGIRILQKIYRLLTPDSKISGMRLCNAPTQVYHALSLTGFLQTVPMYESLQAALDS
ncbi:MAG: hypothetical protein OHK003_15530 [Anaerolineales bacterium]